MSVYVGEYIHVLTQQPRFVTWTPSLAPGMPSPASYLMDGCPGFANSTPVLPQSSTHLSSSSFYLQMSWMLLRLTELKSVFLSFPIIWSKLDRWGLTKQYATLFQSTAHQVLDVPSCHIVGSRLNDPDLFNQSLLLLSPSPLIVLLAFCC